MWICTLAVTGLLVITAGFLLVDPYFFQVDSCLDVGGHWNYKENVCKK